MGFSPVSSVVTIAQTIKASTIAPPRIKTDRIVVLCGGQVSGVVDARKTDKREVGAMMTRVQGGKADE